MVSISFVHKEIKYCMVDYSRAGGLPNTVNSRGAFQIRKNSAPGVHVVRESGIHFLPPVTIRPSVMA